MKARVRAAVAVVVAIFGAGTVLNVAPSDAMPARNVRPASFPSATDAETQLLALLNGERTVRGLNALARTTTLDGFALAWSQFMAGGGCTVREARRLCHRLDLAAMANTAYPGSWQRVGENVGLVPDGGTLASLHQAFMSSIGHRANVLESGYNALGVGVSFDAAGTLFVTYEFVGAIGNPTKPGEEVPTPPPGLSEEESMLFWINDVRSDAGLAPLARHPVLDREAEFWSTKLADGTACTGGKTLCHRPDMSTVTKTAVGAGGSRWWSENVGYRSPSDLLSQFLGFMRSPGHRANILRPNINLVGIGYAVDPLGRAFTAMEFVAAKKPSNTRPSGGSACGWVPSSITKGAQGPYVRTLQCALSAAGVYVGPIDGQFSPAVVAAVSAFQSQKGVTRPNGRADLRTRRLLGLV